MASRARIRLPEQWPKQVKSGILHAISLASVVFSYARGRAASRRRLQTALDQARTEIALLREELGIKEEPASISIVERFIRSMKQECTRRLLVPFTLDAMRREIGFYSLWYNTQRPHLALNGKTPQEVYTGRVRRRRRIEPRPSWPAHGRRRKADTVRLEVSYVDGRKHLPVIELRRAA